MHYKVTVDKDYSFIVDDQNNFVATGDPPLPRSMEDSAQRMQLVTQIVSHMRLFNHTQFNVEGVR